MKKYVFFDIDGTLWDHHQIIPQSTKKAIKMLKENGHAAYINTGRARSNIIEKELLSLGFEGIVAGCGTHIEKNNKVIYEKLMTDEQIMRSLKVLNDNHMPMVYEGPEYHFFNVDDFIEIGDPYVKILKERLGPIAKATSEISKGTRINKFSADISKDTDFDKVMDLLPDFDFINHNGVIVEVIPEGYSKATGIKELMNIENIDLDDVYVVGDSMNDMDMFKLASHSICMGNGDDRIKEVAEYVTTNLHEDGIYNGLKHYGLI
ncbi:MAG: Cof-type HAD-IIB family hydrolase [Butyrivibrio sp.]|uniref:Cof-type HAD-IIB family hydrolase n=1 Tax=Butyrivibrio sp. TaxID=28121 RepID=UPI0025FB777E|nr:Cof-type HAD-IIB family hydrolase [Butyrivibrio sp.]MCR5770650.1 Cof-type HAD-IIB family hydrolase [Butyrivibrio sp.]